MKRYILTGTPGAGKTAILRALEAAGMDVVEEAATDFIAQEQARGVAEPWTAPGFIEGIARLQRSRLDRAAARPVDLQVHDRSFVCTLALARLLQRPVPASLARELDRIAAEATFRRGVLFIETLGFVEPTPARRISYEEALVFERLHEEVYRALGYELVRIPAAPLDERVRRVGAALASDGGQGAQVDVGQG